MNPTLPGPFRRQMISVTALEEIALEIDDVDEFDFDIPPLDIRGICDEHYERTCVLRDKLERLDKRNTRAKSEAHHYAMMMRTSFDRVRLSGDQASINVWAQRYAETAEREAVIATNEMNINRLYRLLDRTDARRTALEDGRLEVFL